MLAPHPHRRHVVWPPQCPADNRRSQLDVRVVGGLGMHRAGSIDRMTWVQVPTGPHASLALGPLCFTCATGVIDIYRLP